MKTLFLDCSMGAAGDMLTAALLELIDDREQFVKELNEVGIPDVEFIAEPSVKCGVTGTHMTVRVNGAEEDEHMHEHHHHHHDDDHDHDHEHDHDDDHEHHHHDYDDEHEHYHHHDHDDEHEHHHHDHEHDHDHEHEHEHDHDHVHAHAHDHEHTHEHGHGHTHSHNDLHGIEHIVNDHMSISEKVREDVLAVYRLIAEAESQVHGMPMDQIHFHEVGTMDAVADVTAVCLLMEKIAPEAVIASPVHVGSGTVKCAHGILPVPAPATALILKDIPVYSGAIRGELCTPTGAALLKHFVQKFDVMPLMKIEKIGYGMGKKDFPQANCVRAILGESRDGTDTVLELSCNVDDMSAEEIAYATENLMNEGAFDVYTVPIGMKKSRPGTLIRVICSEEKRDHLVECIFRHTTTIGLRQTETKRFIMRRNIETLDTEFGPVRIKKASGYGSSREKLEYEDLASIAKENGLSVSEVRSRILSGKKKI